MSVTMTMLMMGMMLPSAVAEFFGCVSDNSANTCNLPVTEIEGAFLVELEVVEDGPSQRDLQRVASAFLFSQLASERRVVKYSRGQPVARFERIVGKRAEALDTTVYGMAARALVGVAVDRREAEVASVTGPEKRATVIKSKWLER